MKLALLVPPKSYWYQPYLAPYILKSYLNSLKNPEITSDIFDLSIDYYKTLWSRDSLNELKSQAVALGLRPQALMLDATLSMRETPYEALRKMETFSAWSKVQMNNQLLRETTKIYSIVDKKNGVESGDYFIPRQYGKWTEMAKRCAETRMGGFLKSRIEKGMLDSYEAIGITVPYIEQLMPAVTLASLIKRRNPNQTVILGGGMASHFLDDFLKDADFFRYIDYLIPYEGEYSLGELLKSLHEKTDPPEKNIAYFKDGKIHYVKALNERPNLEVHPDFSDLKDEYPTPTKVFPILTSKGCYWGKCGYCTHYEGYGQGFYNYKSKTLKEAIESYTKEGARYFYIADESLPPSKLTELGHLFGEIKKNHLKPGEDFGWISEARVEKGFSEPIGIQTLKHSGCKLLVNGIESGSQRILDLMEKGIDVERTEKFARDCWEAGVRVGWLFFVGYPTETEEEANETFRFIDRNQSFIDYAAIGSFAIEKGSPLWLDPKKNGIKRIINPDTPYAIGFDYEAADGTTVSRFSPGKRLADLQEKYSESVLGIQKSGIDRTLAFFFPNKSPHEAKIFYNPAEPQTIRWESTTEKGLFELDVDSMTIKKSAPKPVHA